MIIKRPKHHSKRIINRFLFFPVTIRTWSQDPGETRWMEFASIEQTYYSGSGWQNTDFV